MKKIELAGFVVVLVAAAAVSRAQELPQMPSPQKEHEWLEQLSGEWQTETELYVKPGEPPLKGKGAESARMIGGFWLMAENKGDMFNTPFTGILTVGYDAEKKTYVGTWIDSMTSYLWTYVGTVDADGKTLTLETEGPSHSGPGKMAKYKEVIELKSKDHKVFTSSVQGDDGKWTTMVKVDYRRKSDGR